MSVWEDIKNRLSIEEVIGDYIQVRSKGVNFTCLCPFHSEKTPSMVISTEKQIWHCFGCGAGGDIFAFVSQIENIEKKEALEILAKKADIKLAKFEPAFSKTISNKPIQSENNSLDQNLETLSQNSNNLEFGKKEKSEFEKGREMLSWSADLYHQILLKTLENPAHPVTKYCLERGLTPEIIVKFKIGFAPSNSPITKLLTDSKSSLDVAVKVGLIKT